MSTVQVSAAGADITLTAVSTFPTYEYAPHLCVHPAVINPCGEMSEAAFSFQAEQKQTESKLTPGFRKWYEEEIKD